MFSFVTWDWLQGIIRHFLTFAGGYVVAQGWITADVLPELIGALMTIAGLIWSAVSSKTKVAAVAVEKAVDASSLVNVRRTSTTTAAIVPAPKP